MTLATDTISISTIVEILGFVITLAVGWGILKSNIDKVGSNTAQSISYIEENITKIENTHKSTILEQKHQLEIIGSKLENDIRDIYEKIENKHALVMDIFNNYEEKHGKYFDKKHGLLLIDIEKNKKQMDVTENNLSKRIGNVGSILKQIEKDYSNLNNDINNIYNYEIKQLQIYVKNELKFIRKEINIRDA